MALNYEIYKLWFEYLQQNKPYKIFCEWFKNITVSPPKELNKYCLLTFCRVEEFWGDIHSHPWEWTWERINHDPGETPLIEEYHAIQEKIINWFGHLPIKDYRNWEEALISGKYFENHLTLTIKIDAPLEEIEKQFKILISEKQKNINIKAVHKKKIPVPSRRLNQEDIYLLRRYLAVYDLKINQNLSYKEVIDRIDPDGKIHPGEYVKYEPRVWTREVENARDIIKNTGHNIFPGKYGQRKKCLKT